MLTYGYSTPVETSEKTENGLARTMAPALLRLMATLAAEGALVYLNFDMNGRNAFALRGMVVGVEGPDESEFSFELKPAL